MAALKWRLYNRVPLLECTRCTHALRIKCASHVFLVKIITNPRAHFFSHDVFKYFLHRLSDLDSSRARAYETSHSGTTITMSCRLMCYEVLRIFGFDELVVVGNSIALIWFCIGG